MVSLDMSGHEALPALAEGAVDPSTKRGDGPTPAATGVHGG